MIYPLDQAFSTTPAAASRIGQPRMGIVTSSNNRTASARVLLQPEGILTGWLPVLTHWAGNGWGMYAPLSPGDQVLIIAQEGDGEHGVIAGSLFSRAATPPAAEPGELVLFHKSGSSLRLVNSGRIVINGDLYVSGDVYDAHGPLSRLRNAYNQHSHVAPNGAATSLPSILDARP